MYKLAIFDLDGTLLDTLTDLAYACNKALRQYHFKEHPTEKYKTYVGNGVDKLIERALPSDKRQKEVIQKLKNTFETYYSAHSLDHTQPYAGITTLLHRLQQQGVYRAVASNKPNRYTQELVNLIFKNKIELAFGQRDGIAPKPDPQVIKDIMEHFQVEAKECIYIGDSDVDMYTAQNAGLVSVGVLWGFRTRKELEEAGAHYIVSDVQALEEIILKTGRNK